MTSKRNAYKALESVVGSENISDDPAILLGYQYGGMAYVTSTSEKEPPRFGPKAEAVVLPGSTEEVQGIVKVCNRYKIKFKAHSTGFGGHTLPGQEGVVMVDLRRMNRLIDIDEKNMYAVIEPYVTGSQLQAEAWKRGLDCLIASAGGSHSPLASASSYHGNAFTGLTMSCNQRNLLGVEWVMPTGEVMRIGSPGSGAGWFAGDGPGPDFRGIIRGFSGAAGGLGIFTKIGYKLYAWYGPDKIERTGQHPLIGMKLPENFKYYYPYWETWEDMREATYRMHEAGGLAHSILKVPADSMGWYLTATNAEFYEKYKKKALPIQRKHRMGWNVIIVSRTKKELAYKKKVFEKIVGDTKGKFLEVTPEQEAIMPLSTINPYNCARIFRPTKLAAVMGSSTIAQQESVGLMKKIMETDEKCQAEYVKPRGKWLESGPDQIWSWSQEGRQLWTESIHYPDPDDPDLAETCGEYYKKCLDAIDEAKAGLNFDGRTNMGPFVDKYGPRLCNVQDWARKIKNAFDPQNSSDHSFYVAPEPPK